ncbi:MAG: class I SAM-dependent methyltransferase [Deltaproteobacteria bacterium]|nr:class I SAM-dependent methyltransferase [Deltaproteobacteria bacterium]
MSLKSNLRQCGNGHFMSYQGRPSASPVIAGLFAAGVIDSAASVLDIGCFDGTDCLALLAWGVQEVHGIDIEQEHVNKAYRRAQLLAARLRLPGSQSFAFHCDSITRLHRCFHPRQFNVVIDSLCWNNISVDHPAATPAYARNIHRILKPQGLFVLQFRQDRHPLRIDDPRTLPSSFDRFFDLGPLVTTHLAEHPQRRGQRGHAAIGITIGRRRRSPRK